MSTKKKFEYKEVDQEGEETLEAIAQAYKFNQWMYETINPYTHGKILEIGSGIGNISQFFIKNKQQIYLSDIRENYCSKLEDQFSQESNVGDILQLDLVHPDFERTYADYLNYFDTLFALNVVEHIENDTLALQNCKKLLKPGGTIIILVPAFQSLYNRFDEELYHYRRYTRSSLGKVFERSEIPIIAAFYFNFMGIPGWYVSGKLQKNKTIPKGQMQLYEKLVPIFRIIDRIMLRQIGLSVITVGRLPGRS